MSMNALKIWTILKILGALLYLQPINTSKELDRLVDFHIQLYKAHCGDVPYCDKIDRIVYDTPVPCCLPCSCSTTCLIQQNCCPQAAGLGHATDNIRSIDTRRLANQSKETDLGVSPSSRRDASQSTKDPAVSQSISIDDGDGDRDVNYNQEIKLDGDTLRTDILTEQTQSRDATQLENNSTGKIEHYTACIRPQMFYHPNFFVDSKAYMMIVKCIKTIRGTEIVQDCRDKQEKLRFYKNIPVTSRQTGLSYINTFCLLCNEDEVAGSSVVDMWDVKLVHYAMDYYYYGHVFHPLSLRSIIKRGSQGYRNIHYVPTTVNRVQRCITYDISLCNQTGLWDTYDELIENICHNGHGLPILHHLPYNIYVSGFEHILRFKNIACIHCNLGSYFNESSLSCGHLEMTELHSFSLTLNIRKADPNGDVEDNFEDLQNSRMYGAILDMPKTNVCPSGYIALLVSALSFCFVVYTITLQNTDSRLPTGTCVGR